MKKFFLYFSITMLTILASCSDSDILSDLGGGKKIYYTTIDGKKVQFDDLSGHFDAVLVSNTYENDKGCLTFDEKVTKIGDYAFRSCSSLASVTIPNSVTSIGGSAFQDCSSLASITIPDSVTEIGEFAFNGCSSLVSVTIPNGVTSIGSLAFKGCSSLASITIPDGVTEIGGSAFENCSSLESVTIPDSVTWIGGYAFEDCSSLASITIPDGVTEIGWHAFEDCSSLAEVYCKPTTPPTGGVYMFEDNASGRKIYVPTESVNAYKSAEWWREYADDIVGYDFE